MASSPAFFFFFALAAAIDFHLNFFFILGDRSQNREARRRLAPFSLPVAHNFLFFFGIDVIWWQGSGLIGRQGVKGLCHHTLIFVAIFRLPFFFDFVFVAAASFFCLAICFGVSVGGLRILAKIVVVFWSA